MLTTLFLALAALPGPSCSAAVVRTSVQTGAAATAIPVISANAADFGHGAVSLMAPASLSNAFAIPQAPKVAGAKVTVSAAAILPAAPIFAAQAGVMAAAPGPGAAPASPIVETPQVALESEGAAVKTPIASTQDPSLVDRLAKAVETPQADIFDNSVRSAAPGVKVCGVNEKASVLAALSAARSAQADNLIIGLLVGITHFSREKVATKDAPELVRYIRDTSKSMGVPVRIAFVTHAVRAASLIGMIGRIARRVQPGRAGRSSPADIIQIHDAMPLGEIAKVKKAFPGSKIIKALSLPRTGEPADLGGLLAQAVALASQPFIDGLLLDSANPARDQIGGTGLTNDWNVARSIIDRVHEQTGKPVALAGGLNPENATAAFAATHADMLDANSGFRLDPEHSALKDPAAIFSVLRQMKGEVSLYFRKLWARMPPQAQTSSREVRKA
ncbi:MAG: hypothetical protein NTY77_17695 [Elusimicrobia bacterium]|nr:hypothetical protein [Elusimicrobiota bacterium]